MLRGVNGSGGGAPVGGSGTTNTIPRWTGASTLGDSIIVQNAGGTAIAIGDAAGVSYVGLVQVKRAGGAGWLTLDHTGGSYAEVQSYNVPLYLNRQGNNTILNATSGNVGIGTTTPASALHVRNNTAGITLDSTLGGGRQYQLNPLRTGLSNSGFEIRDVTAGTGVLWFDATQQVGIGTPTPASRLDVAGTITCDDAGTGLKLPATPGNADTQTLDCYAEGTWTPTLTGFGGTNPTVTASYTRVGRLVTLTVQMDASGGAQYSSTLATTTLTTPAGMTPAIVAGGNVIAGGAVNYGSAAAWTSGVVYLPTFALTTATTSFSITYRV